MEDKRKILIVGAGDHGADVARVLVELARNRDYEIVYLAEGETIESEFERSCLDDAVLSLMEEEVIVLSALQEQRELEFVARVSSEYGVAIVCSPNSDALTWFEKEYEAATVYSWQQAQEELFDFGIPNPTVKDLALLKQLNTTANDGRGSSVVKSIIVSLDRGDTDGAATIARTDADKIRQYPELFHLLDTLGYDVR